MGVDRNTVKIYFSLGMKLIISTVSVSLFAQCDVLLLEHLVGTNETGAFSAALRISAIWFMCAGIIGNAFSQKLFNWLIEMKMTRSCFLNGFVVR